MTTDTTQRKEKQIYLTGNVEKHPLFLVKGPDGNPVSIPVGDALAACYHEAENAGVNTLKIKSALQQALAQVRERLNDNLNDLLHQEEYRELEAEWSAIIQLSKDSVDNVEIQCLDVTKDSLAEDTEREQGDNLFYQVCSPPYFTAGADPYTGVVVSHEFDGTSPRDMKILSSMADTAKDLHFMLMGSLAPKTLGLDSWSKMPKNPTVLRKKFEAPELAAFNSFRQSEPAQYVTLSAVRQVARAAYHQDKNPIKDLNGFSENVARINDVSLISPAYSVARFFVSRLAASGLPWSMTSYDARKSGETFCLPRPDGESTIQSLEFAVDDRYERALADNGVNTVIHQAKSDSLFYYGLNTLYDPPVSPTMSDEEKRDAMRLRDFQVMAVTQRFAHCIQEIQRKGLGAIVDLADREKTIGSWLDCFTTGIAAEATEKPLKMRVVKVTEDPAYPGKLYCALELYFHSFATSNKVTIRLK